MHDLLLTAYCHGHARDTRECGSGVCWQLAEQAVACLPVVAPLASSLASFLMVQQPAGSLNAAECCSVVQIARVTVRPFLPVLPVLM